MWNLLQDELGGGVWPRLLVALVDTGAKGLILMAAAGLAAAALRRNAAAARHLVWMLALCGLLFLPVVSLMMPKWTLPILPAIEAPAVAPIAATPPIATAPAAPAVVSTPMTEIAPAVPNVIPPTARSGRPPAPIGATPPESAQAPMNYSAWLLATWLAFALLSLAPFAAGVVAVARMRRRAEVFSEGDLQALASALGRCIGLKRPARLLRGPAGSMPMATGFITPAVFLPDDALAWTEEKRRVVLLHELAHVKRRDCLTHAIARTATALHWFNPLAWLALRQLRIEREHACDDLVLAAGERPSAYAENLLEIARTLRASTVVSAAAITMAQKSQLEGRLLAVLDAARNRGRVTKRLCLAILSTMFAALMILSPLELTRARDLSVPAYAQGKWRADGKKVTINGVSLNLPLSLEIDARGAIVGHLGDVPISDAQITTWTAQDSLEHHQDFGHKIEGHLKGFLDDTLYDGPVLIGLIDQDDHWLARPFIVDPSGGSQMMFGLSHYMMERSQTLRFAGGLAATIVAVGDSHGAKPHTFWHPDGTPIGAEPLEFESILSVLHPSKDEVEREFLFRILPQPGGPAATDISARWRILAPSTSGSGGQNVQDNVRYIKAAMTIPQNLTSADLELGIAADPWVAVVEAGFAMSSTIGEYSLAVGKPYEQEGELTITVSHNVPFEKDCRLVAFDQTGVAHPLVSRGTYSADQFTQAHYSLESLSQKNLQRLELQVRDFDWKKFEGIALNPDTAKTPKISESPEAQNAVEADPARPDGAFSVDFPGGYRAHVIGVGDTIGESSGVFWAADGSPMALAPEGVTADVSHVTITPETIGRKFFVELLPPPDSHALTDVRFECSIESPGSSATIASTGSVTFLRNVFDATFPMNTEDASIKVGVAAGPWKTVFSGCIGCDTGASESEIDASFSEAFDHEGAKLVSATHKPLEQECRVVAIDGVGSAHPLLSAGSVETDEMSYSNWIFQTIAPEDVKGLEIQIRDYEWRTIDGIALYPHEKSLQSNAEQSSANSSDSPYSVFNNDYFSALLEDPNLLTRIAGDAILPPAANTTWGPVVNGLQAAVRFKPEKAEYALGETIGMEFLVRNAGPIPLEFLTSKWRNGDQCFVTDDQGKKRGGGTSQGTGLNPVRRIKLAPGEVAAIESASFTIMPEASGRSPLHPVATWASSHAGIHKAQFRIHFPDTYARSGENAPRPDDWTGMLMTGERTIEFVDDPELFRAHSVFQIRMVAPRPGDKGAKAFPWEASNRPPGEVDELWLLDDVLVGDGDLASVVAVPGATPHQYAIEISLNEKASGQLALATRENIGHRMACMYQEMILAAPILNGPVGDGKFVVRGKFNKDVAESIISEIRAANALDTKAPFMQPSKESSLGPEVEVTVRHSGENCMIDFDTGKLFTTPEFNGTEDAFAWCAKNGIDAGGGNQPEVRGLIGMDLVLNPEANTIWEAAETNGALKHDAFKYGTPGKPVYLSAKGELPATWTVKTREGGLGIVQILGFEDEEPRGVKIRYRMLEKGSE